MLRISPDIHPFIHTQKLSLKPLNSQEDKFELAFAGKLEGSLVSDSSLKGAHSPQSLSRNLLFLALSILAASSSLFQLPGAQAAETCEALCSSQTVSNPLLDGLIALDPEKVEMAIQEGMDPNQVVNGRSPLMFATFQGDQSTVEALLKLGAVPTDEDIEFARVTDQKEIADLLKGKMELLKKEQVEQNGFEGMSEVEIVTQCILNHDYKNLEIIFRDAGFDPDGPLADGQTPLSLAISQRDERAIEILLEAGAFPTRQNLDNIGTGSKIYDTILKAVWKFQPAAYGRNAAIHAIHTTLEADRLDEMRDVLEFEHKYQGEMWGLNAPFRASNNKDTLWATIDRKLPEHAKLLVQYGAKLIAFQDLRGELVKLFKETGDEEGLNLMKEKLGYFEYYKLYYLGD